jgi:Ca-activated chloride channel family protein
MSDVSFKIDLIPLFTALLLGAIFFLGLKWKKNFRSPYLGVSSLREFQTTEKGKRTFWRSMPEKLLWSAFFLFLLAFIDPRFYVRETLPEAPKRKQDPTEGIAIYFILDHSGSMEEAVPAPDGGRRKERKIDLLKQVTAQFIRGDPKLGLPGRGNDMIGLITFARGAQVLSPLTLDHQAVLKQLAKLDKIGDMEQDGTAIGYALFKAANLIAATRHYAQELSDKGEPAYTIKNYVMILVTDGLQDPNPLDKGKRLRNIDIPEAANYIKEQGIRLYAIAIEPKLSTEAYAPYRRLMNRVTELTGGKFYLMSSSSNLRQIYAEIDQLEKSTLPSSLQDLADMEKDDRPDLYRRRSLAPYLIAASLLCLLLAIILDTTVLRKAP